MSKIFVVTKKQIRLFAVVILVVLIAAACLKWNQSKAAMGSSQEQRVIQLVTGEFRTTTSDGKKLEVYRWDPGTVIANVGDSVELRIAGVNGQSHPFVIEGLNIKGEVVKGKTTVVRFTAERKGTFPIVCLTHDKMENSGPMVGYIVIQ
ncbi:cupredoxin domain-containing protein [Paenibacillus oenotherae]|uniref:Cupredoxin domain-containing protein n=1 Tax=Paenibacillus oenotherae TaxID=1435645 RepID=A0ABS7DB09_9BACL|nr:cupredoxin domain-containing protein [Paenibacillus oenotherae]MBW7476781.1 cupredoxin domain-containing protein [Paenibacillus oenotherae]